MEFQSRLLNEIRDRSTSIFSIDNTSLFSKYTQVRHKLSTYILKNLSLFQISDRLREFRMPTPESSRVGPYLIAVCILAPLVCLLLILLCCYALCSNKRRSNWFENTLLEENEKQTTIRFTVTQADDSETECIDTWGDSRRKRVRFQPLSAIVEVLKGLKKLTTRFKSLGDPEAVLQNGNKTEWIVCSRRSMGSSPSSPVHEPVEEKFWVPPAVVDRKRAQSLVPTPCHDSEDGRCCFYLFFVYLIFVKYSFQNE